MVTQETRVERKNQFHSFEKWELKRMKKKTTKELMKYFQVEKHLWKCLNFGFNIRVHAHPRLNWNQLSTSNQQPETRPKKKWKHIHQREYGMWNDLMNRSIWPKSSLLREFAMWKRAKVLQNRAKKSLILYAFRCHLSKATRKISSLAKISNEYVECCHFFDS